MIIFFGKVPFILAVFCLLSGSTATAPAQALPTAAWVCGTNSQDNAPVDLGTAISSSYSFVQQSFAHNASYSANAIESEKIVFSTKGLAYDGAGNVTGYETIVRPSADVQAEASWLGAPGYQPALGPESWGIGGAAAYIHYYARIAAKAGVPTTDTNGFAIMVPLNIRLRGYAKVSDGESLAQASSSIDPLTSDCSAIVNADNAHPYAEYDQTYSINVGVNHIMDCYANGQISISCDLLEGATHAMAEAFADPEIKIDPVFADKDFYFLEYSPNLPVTAPAPTFLITLKNANNGFADIQLTAPLNNVYELQASTNGLSANDWHAIAVATNLTGTVIISNCPTFGGGQTFYRAKAVRLAN